MNWPAGPGLLRAHGRRQPAGPLVLPVPFLANIGLARFLIPIVSVGVALSMLPAVLASVGPFLDRPRLRQEYTPAGLGRPGSPGAALPQERSCARSRHSDRILILVFAIDLGEPKSGAGAEGHRPRHPGPLQTGGCPPASSNPWTCSCPTVRRATWLTRSDRSTGCTPPWSRTPRPSTATGPLSSRSSRRPNPALRPVAPPFGRASRGQAPPRCDRGGGRRPGPSRFVHAVYGSFPLMLTLIGIATLLLLTRAFRSIVLAVKVVLLNMLSVAAAYGVMVFGGKKATGASPCGRFRPPAPSRCGSRSWCSPSCLASPWTTRCSSSPASGRNMTRT